MKENRRKNWRFVQKIDEQIELTDFSTFFIYCQLKTHIFRFPGTRGTVPKLTNWSVTKYSPPSPEPRGGGAVGEDGGGAGAAQAGGGLRGDEVSAEQKYYRSVALLSGR